MSDTYTTIHGVEVLVCAPDGAQLTSERDALDLIGEAMGIINGTPTPFIIPRHPIKPGL